MASGKIRFGKQSGGELALVIPDGVANTEVTFPESGVLATKQYVDDTSVKLTGNQTVAGVKTFSSSPIVPTPTTNTQAANKAYADLKVALSDFTGTNVNLDNNGYQKLPSGLIIQWGNSVASSSHPIYAYPIAFTNSVFIGITSDWESTATINSSVAAQFSNVSKSQFSLYIPTGANNVNWIAIGY